jgi:hypothetical protein
MKTIRSVSSSRHCMLPRLTNGNGRPEDDCFQLKSDGSSVTSRAARYQLFVPQETLKKISNDRNDPYIVLFCNFSLIYISIIFANPHYYTA